MFPWRESIGNLICPNKQVKMLTETLLNIFSNFILGSSLDNIAYQNFILKKNRAYKSFVRNGRPNEKLEAMNEMTSRGSKLIEDAKDRYFKK